MENEQELLRREKSKIERGDLEKRVCALERELEVVRNNFSNLQSDLAGLSEEMENAGQKTWTAEEIKERMQKWFDKSEFTLQKHSHIDDKSGGDAFARLGGNLI